MNPFRLDSPRPTISFRDYALKELRYAALAAARPQEADGLLAMAEAVVADKYRTYEDLAARDGSRFHPDAAAIVAGP